MFGYGRHRLIEYNIYMISGGGPRRRGLLGQIQKSCEEVETMVGNADSKIRQNRQGVGLDPVHRHQMTSTNIVMETTPPKPTLIAQKNLPPGQFGQDRLESPL